ncbi:MAG: helix-turn-helix transcriptional regulator [Saprospiraceae bacterium]|nr:helix-turn-helix transcriptional regulator [Saprospiraceae bacterium]
MMATEMINYQRIEQAIQYLSEHFTEQPNLDDVAAQVHLSPYHFQRMFTEWAGISPKKFLWRRPSGASAALAACMLHHIYALFFVPPCCKVNELYYPFFLDHVKYPMYLHILL